MRPAAVQVAIDCADPDRLASFWAEALGYEKDWEWDEATVQWMLDSGLDPSAVGSRSAVTDPDGAGPRFFFQRVPEGKAVKNRVHVDVKLGVEDVERLVALGATVVREVEEQYGPFHERHVVMQDPEGNEFCVS